jgi:AraC-like DNA-binding protein
MNPKLDLYSFINLFGALNGFFFAVIIVRMRRGHPKTNRLAALLLVNLAVIAAGSFCAYSGYFRIYPKLQKLFSPFFFVMGPLFFFYVRSLLRGDRPSGGKKALHFIPALLNVICYIPFYLKSDAEKVARLALGVTPAARVIRILALAHFLIYLVLVLRHIRGFQALAREQFASPARTKIRWVVYLGLAMGTIHLVNVTAGLHIPFVSYLAVFWEALLIVFLGYKGLTQPSLFLDENFWDRPAKSDSPPVPEDRQNLYLRRITDFMAREKPYLDPELTLNALAEKLRMPANHCSFLINRHLKMNFFHFVNHYRIDEFKRRLSGADQPRTILETALDVGFNSKSTFNAAFKQSEGVTPSQYLKATRPSPRPTL